MKCLFVRVICEGCYFGSINERCYCEAHMWWIFVVGLICEKDLIVRITCEGSYCMAHT